MTANPFTAMRRLLSSEKRWRQGTYAVGKSGRAVSVSGRFAVAWCLGGIARYDDNTAASVELLERAITVEFPRSTSDVEEFNDAPHRRFSHIQRVLRRAETLWREAHP